MQQGSGAINIAAFDLGDTLVEYEGLPLSWESHYDSALLSLANFLGASLSKDKLIAGREILRKYNTRLHPRTKEVTFATILSELLPAVDAKYTGATDDAATAFFSVFRQKLRCFPDTVPALASLRSRGIRIGVVTDAPYGMPTKLIREDMRDSGVLEWIDEVVTSVEAGVRKPNSGGLVLLASRLNATPSKMFYVGNEKKDIEAALAFGCEPILLDRHGVAPAWNQHRTIGSLAEL